MYDIYVSEKVDNVLCNFSMSVDSKWDGLDHVETTKNEHYNTLYSMIYCDNNNDHYCYD